MIFDWRRDPNPGRVRFWDAGVQEVTHVFYYDSAQYRVGRYHGVYGRYQMRQDGVRDVVRIWETRALTYRVGE
jgi:hypothetical protein